MTKNKSITELLQPFATYDTDSKKLIIDVGTLDPNGEISTGEGCILSLLRVLSANQDTSQEKAMEIGKEMPFISQRAGATVQGTALQLRFFGSTPLGQLNVSEV